jgi:transposase
LETIYADTLFANLFPKRGQPAEAPGHLAVVCVLQFAEGLSGRQAADALRSRIDWKYLLGLELENPSFDFSILSEFRDRLLWGGQAQRLLDDLLECFRARGLLKERGTQRIDSTHIQAALRNLNRLECVGETLRYTLNSLVRIAPEWLKARAPTACYKRYGARFEQYRLPKTESEREKFALQIGQDGRQLLGWVNGADSPAQLQHCPAVEILWHIWVQQ